MRAKTGRPSALAFSALINITAAAPSLSVDELPAVTEPSFLKAGRNLLSDSAVLPARGCSSVAKITGSPFALRMLTGVIHHKSAGSNAATSLLEAAAKASWFAAKLYCSQIFA